MKLEHDDYDPGSPKLSAHQQKVLASYPKGFDPGFANWLARADIKYGVLSSMPMNAVNYFYQSATGVVSSIMGPNGPVPAAQPSPGGGPGGFQPLDPAGARAYVRDSWNQNPNQQLFNAAGVSWAGAQGTPSYQAPTATPSAPAAPKNASLAPQPAAPGSGGAGAPASAYTVPRMTGGQLANELKAQGFNFPFDISPMIQQALRESNGDATTAMSSFLSTLYKSAQFKHYYPSYFAPNGTARFSSPGDYDQKFNQYQSVAQRQGFKLTRQQFGNVANAGKSIDEFTADTQIAGTIKNNGALLKNFNSIAASSGVKGLHSAQDAYNFLTGRGDPKQYQVWNAAAGVTAAKAAGVNVSTSEAKSATGGLQSAVSYDDIEKSYADLAQKVKDSGAELGAFGVSQRDLETLEFGGANRSLIAARVSQAMSQTQAQGQGVGEAMTATAAGVPVAAQQVRPGE